MKIVHADEVPVTGSPKVRGGSGHSSQILFDSDLLGRDPSRPDNFFMQISHVGEGQFKSPRHRHNFEQFRYMIAGEADYPEGVMRDGTLGYFPEGAKYGPQEKLVGTVVILQFGGPSGSGFVDRKLMKAAFEEMKPRNTGCGVHSPPIHLFKLYRARGFKEGMFMIEWVRKRPMTYPEPQYATPILIHSEAFPWNPLPGCPGVAEKALGTFSSGKMRTARFRLDPGASLEASGRGAWLVLDGTGKLADGPYRKLSALYLEEGEAAIFTAETPSDILLLGLPAMSLISLVPPGIAS